MAITAIVINYNAGEDLCQCVQSLLDNGITDIRVVDNASSDGSLERLRGRYGRQPAITTLANASNLGFGPAVNAVASNVDGPWLLVINPDCRLEKGAAQLLRQALEHDSQSALAGPCVMDGSGKLEGASLRRVPTPARALVSATGLARVFRNLEGVNVVGADRLDSVTQAQATSGACMMMRTDAFREVHGFDECYLLHCEDLDLMARLQKAGWRCLYVPRAGATHRQGVSSASRPWWVHRQKHRGLARYFRTHVAPECGLLARWLMPMGIWAHWLILLPFQGMKRRT